MMVVLSCILHPARTLQGRTYREPFAFRIVVREFCSPRGNRSCAALRDAATIEALRFPLRPVCGRNLEKEPMRLDFFFGAVF